MNIKEHKNKYYIGFLIIIVVSLFFIRSEASAAYPITIKNNAIYTNSSHVSLTLNAGMAGFDEYRVMLSNNGTDWTNWIAYKDYYFWDLTDSRYGGSARQGTRIVYVKFKGIAGNISARYKDTIIFDKTSPRPSITINKNASFSTLRHVKLNLTASDNVSGARWVKISNNSKRWTTWKNFYGYKMNLNWNFASSRYGGTTAKGKKCVYVKFKDRAGNGSTVKKDCIQYITPRKIEIDLSSQNLYLWESRKRIAKYKISSGRPGMRTPTGYFRVLSKERTHWSAKYKLYMPYALRVVGGVYVHELPYWPGGYREGQWHLGIPVSHGCVRLGIGPAKRVYNFSPIGIRVIIHN